MNFDSPTGFADNEEVSSLISAAALSASCVRDDMEVRTMTGQIPAKSQAGVTFDLYDLVSGFLCTNAANPPSGCANYESRYCCGGNILLLLYQFNWVTYCF